MSEKLVKRTMSFMEANIDYQIYMDNIFTINPKPDALMESF